jgi:hypothetical protein
MGYLYGWMGLQPTFNLQVPILKIFRCMLLFQLDDGVLMKITCAAQDQQKHINTCHVSCTYTA